MTRNIAIPDGSADASRQQRRRLLPPKTPLSAPAPTAGSGPQARSVGSRFAEAAGGVAADCTAICCCGPCVTIDLLLLAMVKVPVGLCKKAIRKKVLRRQVARRDFLLQSKIMYEDEEDMWVYTCAAPGSWQEKSPARVVLEMEEEMWATFNGAGFWRSPSRRDE